MTDMPTREYGLLAQVEEEMPATLWHYTDAVGFLGIVTSGELRLGNARFLNDQTEQQFSWAVINEALDIRILKSDQLSKFFLFVKEITAPVELPGHLFVCSLSERSDSISQWQRYGADGQGYCLGLRVRELLRSSNLKYVALRRLIYSRNEQLKRVNSVIDQFCRNVGGAGNAHDDLQKSTMLLMRGMLMLQLSALALTFKHPHFEDEAEWRLLLLVDAQRDLMLDRIRFTSRGPVVKPHIDLAVGDVGRPRVPLRSVICGPKHNAHLALSTAKYLLEMNGQPEATVKLSQIATTWR